MNLLPQRAQLPNLSDLLEILVFVKQYRVLIQDELGNEAIH
jgi:hypothetical protein